MRVRHFLLGVVLLVGLCGCGGDDPDGGGADDGRLSRTALERLQTTDVPGFERRPGALYDLRAVVQYVAKEPTQGGGTIQVVAAVQPCDPFVCSTLDPDAWKGRDEEFRRGVASPYGDDPGLVWSYGAIGLPGGLEGIAQYVASYVDRRSAAGAREHGMLQSLDVRYHDGVNALLLSVTATGGEVHSLEELERRMSRADAEAAARRVFEAFLPVFATSPGSTPP